MVDHKKTDLVCIIDDDAEVRDSLHGLLRVADYNVRAFGSPAEFMSDEAADVAACLILDVNLGEHDGLEFQQELLEGEVTIPVILMSGFGDVPKTVRGMKAGAVTFLSKPFDEDAMLAAIDEAVKRHRDQSRTREALTGVQERYDSLTPREKDLFGLVTAGLMNKQIAGHLELSQVTVKIHRGNMVRKMQADSVADLVRMADMLGVREQMTRYRRGSPTEQDV